MPSVFYDFQTNQKVTSFSVKFEKVAGLRGGWVRGEKIFVKFFVQNKCRISSITVFRSFFFCPEDTKSTKMDGPKTASITDLLKCQHIFAGVKVLPHLYVMPTESSFTIGEAAKLDMSSEEPKKETPAHHTVI